MSTKPGKTILLCYFVRVIGGWVFVCLRSFHKVGNRRIWLESRSLEFRRRDLPHQYHAPKFWPSNRFRITETCFTSEFIRDARHEIVRHGIDTDGAVREVEGVEVRVGEFIFREQREVPGEIEVQAGDRQHTGPVDLITLPVSAADELRFHVGNHRADARADVRLEAPEKILAAFAELPA